MNKYLIYSNDMITIKIPNRQKLEMNYILPNILINFEHPEEQDIDYVQEILNRIDFSSNNYNTDNLDKEKILKNSITSKIIYKEFERIILYVLIIISTSIILVIIMYFSYKKYKKSKKLRNRILSNSMNQTQQILRSEQILMSEQTSNDNSKDEINLNEEITTKFL